ncbi:MAG: RNA methyltransferase [Alphaproteobacteria bacterium]|nr:RNA methyltransferase [Alphaproteobacteria bacterium]
MAGTDHTQPAFEGGPAVILVDPQLGENIGTAARAMYNFGLTDLRLVRPRDGWPSDKARSASSGADKVVDSVRVYSTTAAAIADLNRVYATTARRRDMFNEVLAPEDLAKRLREGEGRGERCGILFGAERTGLQNEDIALADAVVMIPTNPAFSSINIAQAVLLIGYAWFRAGGADVAPDPELVPAPRQDLIGLFEHLERELTTAGFLYPPAKVPNMVMNLRAMLARAGLTEQEVRTLRGVVAALAGAKRRT